MGYHKGMEAQSVNATPHIPTLDGWRAIAILFVIICHSSGFWFSPEAIASGNLLYRILHQGFIGVDIFFGISGFLICTRILDDEKVAGFISLKRFYIRRTFRILPPYFLYLLFLTFLAPLLGLVVPREQLLACYFFLQNYLTPVTNVVWLLGHFWTLAVEEHFYLILPGLLLLLQRGPWQRLIALGLCVLGVAAWRMIDFRLQLGQRVLGEVGFFTRSDIRFDALFFGASFAVAVRIDSIRKVLTAYLNPKIFPFLVFVFVANEALEPPMQIFWRGFLVPLLLLSTIFYPQSYAGRGLSVMPMVWIGRLSYSLYIWNNLFLVPHNQGRDLFPEFLRSVPLNYVMLFAVAAASYFLVEKPCIRWGQRLTRSAAKAA